MFCMQKPQGLVTVWPWELREWEAAKMTLRFLDQANEQIGEQRKKSCPEWILGSSFGLRTFSVLYETSRERQ